MRVAILGTGGIGLAYAAFLHGRGHEPVMWSPSGRGIEAFRAGEELVADGALTDRFRPAFAEDPAFAGDCAAIVVAVPAYGYRAVFDAVLPHVRAGTVVVVSAHLSLAARHVAAGLRARGIVASVLAWSTTALMGRRTGPASVEIGGIRREVDLAAEDPADGQRGLAACAALFGERFRLHGDLMAIQLGNLNPPVHLASALCNLTRIEKGEAWSNYGGITPAVARLIRSLDRERLAVAAAYGVEARSVERHYELTFGFEPGLDLAAMAAEVDRRRGGKPPGPRSLDTRFVLEDVPYGIVPLIRIARRAGVPARLHEAGAALIGALYDRDFDAENDFPQEVDIISPANLVAGCDAVEGTVPRARESEEFARSVADVSAREAVRS